MEVQHKRRITPLQVSRGSVYVVRNSESSPAFGQTTRRFFAQGEAHEANGWQDAILPPDDEPEQRVASGSFDKVPRQKGAMVALALFGIFVAAAVAFGVRAWVQDGHVVEAAVTDFVRGLGTQPSEAPVPPPSTLPPVAEKATAPTEPAFPPGPAAPTSPATPPDEGANLPDDGANVGREGTSAAKAVPSDRKPRAQEEREPSRRPLKVVRQRTMTPGLSTSGKPEPELDFSLDEASDPFATPALVPPRVAAPSIAPANTGAAIPEKAPPSPEQLRVTASDKLAGPAPTARNEPDPFQPGETK